MKKVIRRTSMRTKGGKKVYAKRSAKGRFLDIQSVGKAMKGDRRTKSKTKVKSGFGWRGDR